MTDRYKRQTILPGIGENGQEKLSQAKVLVLGCGALGTVAAQHLVRAGVGAGPGGQVIIADRDFIELSNLQRQVLFDEQDIKDNLPKAEAARRKLIKINSAAHVRAVIEDVNSNNIERVAGGCDLIVDGLDNFDTRFLANDFAVKNLIGYLYGGVVGTGGMVMPILPYSAAGDSPWQKAGIVTPCLQCVFGSAPPPGTGPTCDTAGVLGPAASVIASYLAAEAIKFLTGNFAVLRRSVLQLDMWDNAVREVGGQTLKPDPDCPCCGQRHFDYLSGQAGQRAVQLCGRHAVQINDATARSQKMDFKALAARLEPVAKVSSNQFMLRAVVTDGGHEYELSLFTDGRAIIKGTSDLATARSLYAKYIGS